MPFQAGEGTLFVGMHQSRVPRDVGGDYGWALRSTRSSCTPVSLAKQNIHNAAPGAPILAEGRSMVNTTHERAPRVVVASLPPSVAT